MVGAGVGVRGTVQPQQGLTVPEERNGWVGRWGGVDKSGEALGRVGLPTAGLAGTCSGLRRPIRK